MIQTREAVEPGVARSDVSPAEATQTLRSEVDPALAAQNDEELLHFRVPNDALGELPHAGGCLANLP